MIGRVAPFVTLALALTCSGAAADVAPLPPSPAQAMIVEPQNDATQGSTNLHLGQHLLVHLRAQLGTGSDWGVTSAASPALTALGSKVLSSGSGQPGGFQTQEFEFVAKSAGTADLTFAYRRPWEKSTPPAKTFALHVVIGT
jgi:predicted secreted protein